MRLLWISLLALLLLVGSLVLALRSQSVLLFATHWAVDSFTEYRLALKNPHIDLLEGTVSADEIQLFPHNSSGPTLLTVLGLDVDTSLKDLWARQFRHSHFSAAAVVIYVSENDEASDPQPGAWLQLTNWLPGNLAIDQVHLITTSENTWIFPLKKLQGQWEGDSFLATAMADYEGEPLEASLQLLGGYREGALRSLQLRAGFHATESNSVIALEGTAEGDDEQFRYDFEAKASYRDIGDFIRGLNSETVLNGSLELEARMKGDARSFSLTEANLVLNNMPDYGFEASGELHYARGESAQLQLIAAGEMSKLEYLVDWLDIDVTHLGRARSSVSLSGSLAAPSVENFILISESPEGLSVNVSGQLQSIDLTGAAPDSTAVKDNEIRVDAYAPSLSVLQPWLGEIAFDPGAWRASWIARGDTQRIALENIVLEMGEPETFQLGINGDIAEIANTSPIGLASIKGIDLAVEASSPDSANINRLTGVELPPSLESTASLKLRGSADAITLSDGQVNLSNNEIQASVTQMQGLYRPAEQKPAMSDFSARLQFAVSDTSVVSNYLEQDIPSLGSASASANLAQRGMRYQLSDIDIAIDGDDLDLRSRGRINDLEKLRGVRLENELREADLNQLLALVGSNLNEPDALGKLTGSFSLGDEAGKWNIDNLKVSTVPGAGKVDFSAAGDVDDLVGFVTANLEAELSISDSEFLEAVSGLRLKPVSGRLKIGTSPSLIKIDANASAGDTDLTAEIDIGYEATEILSVEAALHTPRLFLSDIGLQAEQDAEKSYAPAADINTDAQSQLDRLLQNSPAFATDIELNIDGITGENTNIDSLQVHMTGENNRYTLRQFSLVYDDALAEVRGIIDLNTSPPFISLAGEALGVPLSTLSQDLGAPSDIRGRLTARGGLSASGTSTDTLSSTLNGSLAIAMEDTVIQGAAYDILATDLLAWIYSGAALQSSTRLECILARFDIQQGLAATDTIYVESERMIATGEGTFNLPDGKLDLTITPRSRSRSIQIPSEVRIRGDIDDPRVSISPVSATFDATAQALLLIPKLVINLLGLDRGPSEKGLRPCQARLLE